MMFELDAIEIFVLIHLFIQGVWLTATVNDVHVYGTMLFACTLKTSMILQVGCFLNKRVYAVTHFLADALCYSFLCLDYRLFNVFGAHALSPVMMSMLNIPKQQMKASWGTSVFQLAWDGGCVLAFCLFVVLAFDYLIGTFMKHAIGAHKLSLKLRRTMRLLTIFLTLLRGVMLFDVNLMIETNQTYAVPFAPSSLLSLRHQEGGVHPANNANNNHPNQDDQDWCKLETVHMKERPNIVVVIYDSGRHDMFDEHTFSSVHALARKLGPTRCHQWSNHYSGGVQSDSGHVALMYGIIPTRDRLRELEDNKQNTSSSWPFEVLRANGYAIHGISSTTFDYCWALGEECTMHRRIFDFFETPPESLDLGMADKDKWAVEQAKAFLTKHQGNADDDAPYFLVVNLESSHYPYLYPPRYEKHLPTSSIADIWKFMKSGSNEASVAEGVRNRYRNAVTYVDDLIGEYIFSTIEKDISLGQTVFFLTSDHGEFLLDRGQRIGHTVNEYYEEQTHVPALFCASYVKDVHVPSVSGHIDVFPTLLHAAGIKLPSGMLPGRSFFVGKREQLSGGDDHTFFVNDRGVDWTFSTYPWSKIVLLTDGVIKAWTDEKSTLVMVTDMKDRLLPKGQYDERIEELRHKWRQVLALPLPCHIEHPFMIQWMGNTTLPWCLDRKNPGTGALHVYPCWKDGWNQRWYGQTFISMELENGEMHHLVAQNDTAVTLATKLHAWTYDKKTRHLVALNGKCLDVHETTYDIVMSPCYTIKDDHFQKNAANVSIDENEGNANNDNQLRSQGRSQEWIFSF